MSHQIRVAVIGCGSWAREAHLPALASHPGCTIVALVDPDAQALSEASRLFQVEATYSRATEVYANHEIDAVVVATPHSTHFLNVREALEAGAHVLVEKPMVLDPADGTALMRLAADKGREIIVGYPLHYNEQALELRTILAQGGLGELEFVSCLFTSSVRDYYRGIMTTDDTVESLARAPRSETYSDPLLSGGGQGQTQLTHSAALVFWLTGLRPHSVAAFTGNFSLPVDLADAAAVSFVGGALGTIGTTGGRPPGNHDLLELRVYGRTGSIEFDVFRGIAEFNVDGKSRLLPHIDEASQYPKFAPAMNLVDVALGRSPNGSPAAIGQLTTCFLRAMYQSAAHDGAPTAVSP